MRQASGVTRRPRASSRRCLVLAADQASKWWVLDVLHLPEVGQIVLLPVLNLTMVWNRGVTFGLLNGLGEWSSPGARGRRARGGRRPRGLAAPRRSRLVAIALGTIAGGAVSNVIDRLRFGAVVDFIHAHVGDWSWYVFNLADAAIVCGVAALVLDSLLPRARRRARRRMHRPDDDLATRPVWAKKVA